MHYSRFNTRRTEDRPSRRRNTAYNDVLGDAVLVYARLSAGDIRLITAMYPE